MAQNCKECGLKIGGAFGCFGHTKDFCLVPPYGYIRFKDFPLNEIKYFSIGRFDKEMDFNFKTGDFFPDELAIHVSVEDRFSFRTYHTSDFNFSNKYVYGYRRTKEQKMNFIWTRVLGKDPFFQQWVKDQ